MSLKKILAVVMASAMAIGTFAAHALTLDVAEAADETVAAEEAALAAEVGAWYAADATAYSIGTAAELAELATLVNNGTSFKGKTVTLTADIDLEGKEWTPIGKSGCTFQGTFDGAGHIVSNLVITGNKSDVGLFGFTTDGEVKNLTVNNAKVSGYLDVGAVAGTPYTSKYTNIKLTGHVEINGFAYVGGVFGKNLYADAKNIVVDVDSTSYVYANSVSDTTAYRTYVGGVVGFMAEGGHGLYNVSSNIKVTGSTCDIGGITGMAHYGNKLVGVVCTADVYCDDPNENEIGGIAGVWHNQNGTTVTFKDCYYTGTTYQANDEGEYVVVETAVTGPSYSSTGTGTADTSKIEETKAVASVDGVVYGDITEALAAIKDNSNVVIFEGEYDAALNISKANVTVKGVGEVTLNGEYTFKGKNFWVENIDFVCSKKDDYQIYYGTGTFKNCSFNGGNAFRSCYTDGEIVFDGCKIVGSTYGIHFDAGTGSVTVKNCELSGFNAFGYSLSHLTIENTKFYQDEASGYKHSNFWGNTTLKNCTFTPEITLATCAEDIIVTVDNCSVTDGSDVLDAFINGVNEEGALIIDGVVVSKAAKIGDVYFNTLDEAIVAAQDGDTIIIYDGEYALPTTWKNGVTFKAADGATVVFNCQNKKPGLGGASVNFEGITFNWANADYFGLQHSGNLTYTNCTINGQPFLYGTSDTFNNCTFNQTSANAYNVWTYGSGLATFNKCTFNSAGKSVLIYKETDSNTYNVDFNDCTFYASEAVEGKAAIEIDSSLCAFDVEIDGCSSTGFAKGSVSGDTLWNLKKGNADTADIVINGIDVLKANYTVEVEFVKVDDATAEEYDLYRINIIGANDAVINRLNSGELTFNFVHDKPMSYEIVDIANDNITVTNVEGDKYEFHFEDKDGDDTKVENGTGSVITVAEVKFTGYGIYSFNVSDGVVHATKPADNIVDTYVPGGVTADGKKVGTFDIDDNTITNIEIVVPTRKLTVNVTFPNSVEEVYGDNQQMTVKVSGGDLAEALVYDLGSDVKMNDGAYAVIIEGKLTKNVAYNVEVSGAGYRTARYTVTMTDAKVLNFWNNVKDNAVEVEEGKASSAVAKNFLAGDIVADNNINIYDLSAVVSYFATDATTDYDKYVKYDLNRDGKIDSKDVAYVLVSWGA